MSLDGNKIDFEQALKEMCWTLELLDNCVDESLMDTLKKVVSEYDCHFKRDIEDLVDKNVQLEDKVDELESELTEENPWRGDGG